MVVMYLYQAINTGSKSASGSMWLGQRRMPGWPVQISASCTHIATGFPGHSTVPTFRNTL